LVRIAEVDDYPKANYQFEHVLGAVLFDWKQDINYPVSRNVLGKQVVQSITNIRR
jgi:thiosulfate/3-mercaptopyruvate sulfurtransferase